MLRNIEIVSAWELESITPNFFISRTLSIVRI